MEILISNKTSQIEKPGVCPIYREEQIGRTRTGLEARRQSFSICVGQVCSPCGDLGAYRDGCLCSAAFRISPVEAIFCEQQGIAKTYSTNGWSASGVKVIRYYRNENGQIKIAIETPGVIENGLVGKSWKDRYGNSARNSRHEGSRSEDGVVGNESATWEQGRSRFGGRALRFGHRGTEQREK